MSVKDFYNAVTPGSHLTHGVGRGAYTLLTDEDIHSAKLYEEEKIPSKKTRVQYPSVLNEVTLRKYTMTAIYILDSKVYKSAFNKYKTILDSNARYAHLPRLLFPYESACNP